MNIRYSLILIVLFSIACKNNQKEFDATGTFESVETIVSTEATGTIKKLNIEEGQSLEANQLIGYIDTVQLYLRKKQLEAQIDATIGQKPNISIQVAALHEQLKEANLNRDRAKNLLQAEAGTQKQLDDATTLVEVLKRQIEAQESALGITSETINKNVAPLERQIAQVNDQLVKCRIVNPVRGTVLTKYSQVFEIAAPGKALYKIAAIDTVILRAYISGTQLSQIKLGEKVSVRADDGVKNYRNYSGIIYWISDKSEFTPKTVQTKEERAELVYAIKVRVANDGFLKIGMYGDIKF
jgi:HlyD family secretion protein